MQKYSTLPVPETAPPAFGAVPPADAARAWLEQWPVGQRSFLANCFCGAVRAGARTPSMVLAYVQHDLTRRIQWAVDLTQHLHFTAVLQSVTTKRRAALAYAQHVIAWESLPYVERQRQKQERDRQYQQAYMATVPPTQKQLAFLAKLGHTGAVPAHRAEASMLIDGVLSARQGGQV